MVGLANSAWAACSAFGGGKPVAQPVRELGDYGGGVRVGSY